MTPYICVGSYPSICSVFVPQPVGTTGIIDCRLRFPDAPTNAVPVHVFHHTFLPSVAGHDKSAGDWGRQIACSDNLPSTEHSAHARACRQAYRESAKRSKAQYNMPHNPSGKEWLSEKRVQQEQSSPYFYVSQRQRFLNFCFFGLQKFLELPLTIILPLIFDP